MQMKNIIKLLLVFDIILSAFPVIAQKTKATKQPKIVFIISDDHRWDALGAAGNKEIKTPELDKLAREGVYFRQATIHVSQCAPSRATLLTGLPPHQNGYNSNNFLRSDMQWADRFSVPTMPELLQKAGYQTVLVGKWHLATDPWLMGFTDIRTWLPEGAAAYQDSRLARGRSRKKEVIKGFTNGIFANDAIDFLNSPEAKEKPFLLWLASTLPHSPYKPNPSHFEHLYEAQPAEQLIPPAFPSHSHFKLSQEGTPPDSSAPVIDDYYKAVSYLDELTGRVLKALEKQGLAHNTIVVFLGDNGLMTGSRGVNGKVVPWEESVRVPLIIYAPKFAAMKGSSDVPVSSLDLPATMLLMAGIALPKNWVGRDLGPVLAGNKNHGINYAISEWTDTESQFRHYTHRLIRTPQYKLIRWDKPDKPDELYDLISDPHELKNVINKATMRPVRDKLLNQLNVWMVRSNDPARYWPKKNGKTQDLAAEYRADSLLSSVLYDKTPVKVDQFIYDTYVGKYEFVTRGINTISKDGDKLIINSDFGGKSELIPKSENRFIQKNQPFHFTFIKDEKGQVTHLIRRSKPSADVKTIDMKARKVE
jgi:arylsulfatase A-like enzyme